MRPNHFLRGAARWLLGASIALGASTATHAGHRRPDGHPQCRRACLHAVRERRLHQRCRRRADLHVGLRCARTRRRHRADADQRAHAQGAAGRNGDGQVHQQPAHQDIDPVPGPGGRGGQLCQRLVRSWRAGHRGRHGWCRGLHVHRVATRHLPLPERHAAGPADRDGHGRRADRLPPPARVCPAARRPRSGPTTMQEPATNARTCSSSAMPTR